MLNKTNLKVAIKGHPLPVCCVFDDGYPAVFSFALACGPVISAPAIGIAVIKPSV